MNSGVENRLREALGAVAGQVDSDPDWLGVVEETNLGRVEPDDRGVRRSWLLAAASVVTLAGIGVGLWLSMADESTSVSSLGFNYVLPGEVVVQDDPLVVVSAIGPSPAFDTGSLGTELEFEVVDSFDAEVAGLVERSNFGLSSSETITKITLVGRIDGDPWIAVIRDGPNDDAVGGEPLDANLRSRTLLSAEVGGYGMGDIVPRDGLDLIAPPTADEPAIAAGASYASPTGWLNWDLLPPDTAVATFADSDTRYWMRPRAGVAVFPAQFDNGETFTIQALNADGELLRSHSETVRYESDPTVGLKPGDQVGTFEGTDQTGQPLSFEPTGEQTVLLYGAEWCQGCQDGLAEVSQAIGQLPRSTRVASVSQYNEDALWPTDTAAWPYPRVLSEPNSPLRGVTEVPAVVLLDGDNAVVSIGRGHEGILEILDQLMSREMVCAQLLAEAGVIAEAQDQLSQRLKLIEEVAETSPDPRTAVEAEVEADRAASQLVMLAERSLSLESRLSEENC